jgi:hypothetical protein
MTSSASISFRIENARVEMREKPVKPKTHQSPKINLPQEPQIPPSDKLALFVIDLDDLFILFARKRDIQAGLFELAGEELGAFLGLGVFV